MPTIPSLPFSVRKSVVALAHSRESTRSASLTLDSAADELKSTLGDGAALKVVRAKLEQAKATLEAKGNRQALLTRKSVRAHFDKLGITEGAVVELEYPKFKFSLDDDGTVLAVPCGAATQRICVKGFSIKRANHHSDVALNLEGHVRRNDRGAYNTEVSLQLEPGRSFTIIKPAP
jgi:hypothetical protein